MRVLSKVVTELNLGQWQQPFRLQGMGPLAQLHAGMLSLVSDTPLPHLLPYLPERPGQRRLQGWGLGGSISLWGGNGAALTSPNRNRRHGPRQPQAFSPRLPSAGGLIQCM